MRILCYLCTDLCYRKKERKKIVNRFGHSCIFVYISLVVAAPLTSAIKGVSLFCCTGMGGVVVLRVSVGGGGGVLASLCVRVLLLLLFVFCFVSVLYKKKKVFVCLFLGVQIICCLKHCLTPPPPPLSTSPTSPHPLLFVFSASCVQLGRVYYHLYNALRLQAAFSYSFTMVHNSDQLLSQENVCIPWILLCIHIYIYIYIHSEI